MQGKRLGVLAIDKYNSKASMPAMRRPWIHYDMSPKAERGIATRQAILNHLNADKRKVLGSGTSFAGGQVDTWQINGKHELLAGILGEPL